MSDGKRVNLIVAVAENGVIGRENSLPWRQSADLSRFRHLTMGGVVIMGRKTYESLPGNLPGRKQIVITRNNVFPISGDTIRCSSVEEALAAAKDFVENKDIWVIGGAQIYESFMPLVDFAYLTRIKAVLDGDAHFRLSADSDWKLVAEENHCADSKNEYNYDFQVYRRSSKSGNVHTS